MIISPDNYVEYPNIDISSIQIVSDNGSFLELYNRTDYKTDGYFSFDKLFIEEDMFGGPIFGSLEFYDSAYLIEQLNLTVRDRLYFKLDGKEYNFRILDVNVNTDLASKKTHGPGGSVYKISIRFTCDEFFRGNYDFQPLENFIGKISKGSPIINNKGEKEENIKLEIASATEGLPNNSDYEKELKGFVQEVMKYLSEWSEKPLSADNTSNDIWFKTDPSFYPFSKISSPSKMFQMLNYAAEYACYDLNPKATNFFFWEDLDKWNFRCIESLWNEPVIGTYIPGLEEYKENSIVSIETISDISPLKLYEGGALKSEYIRIKPNWADPYRTFIDTVSGITKELVSYDYYEDAGNWERIAAYSPFKQEFIKNVHEDETDSISFKTHRLNDTNYGYYSNSYNTKNIPWWNYLDPMHDHALGTRLNTIKNIKNEKEYFEKIPSTKQTSRLDTEHWQAQFDFCELPGSYLSKIYKEIKWNLELAKSRKDYAELKRYQKKLEVYRRKVCCEREVPSEFLALIIGADKIYGGDGISFAYDSGGIYAYRWIEVEVWPSEEAGEILNTSQQIIKFDESGSGYPFVFSAPYWAFEGITRQKTVVEIKNENNRVIERKTTYTPDTRAFNLSELLNSAGSTLFESSDSFQGEQQIATTLLMNNGISSILDKSQIPVDEQNRYSSYPKNFAMMPVGKFRVVGKTCPDWLKNGETINKAEGNDGGFYFAGRIVKMNAIPADGIDTLLLKGALTEIGKEQAEDGIPATDSKALRKYLFIFDVDNAHDGLCIDCET